MECTRCAILSVFRGRRQSSAGSPFRNSFSCRDHGHAPSQGSPHPRRYPKACVPQPHSGQPEVHSAPAILMAWARAMVGPALLRSSSSGFFCFYLLPSTEADLSLVSILNPTSMLISQVALGIKNLPASAGDVRDTGSIPASVTPLEEGMAAHSSTLAWRIPRTEEPGGLQSIGSQSWTQVKRLSTHTHSFLNTRKVSFPS